MLLNQGRTIFAQLMDCFLSQYAFNQTVDKHQGDHRVRTLSCLDQFRAMAFAQAHLGRSFHLLVDATYRARGRGPTLPARCATWA